VCKYLWWHCIYCIYCFRKINHLVLLPFAFILWCTRSCVGNTPYASQTPSWTWATRLPSAWKLGRPNPQTAAGSNLAFPPLHFWPYPSRVPACLPQAPLAHKPLCEDGAHLAVHCSPCRVVQLGAGSEAIAAPAAPASDFLLCDWI
jgi:hypothetical protein